MVALLSAVHYMPTFSVNVRLGSVNVRLGRLPDYFCLGLSEGIDLNPRQSSLAALPGRTSTEFRRTSTENIGIYYTADNRTMF